MLWRWVLTRLHEKVKLLQSEEVRISLESNGIASHAPFLDVSGVNQVYAQKHYPMNVTQTKPTSICWPTHFRPLKWIRKRLKSPDLEHQPALKPLNSLPWSSKKSNYRFFSLSEMPVKHHKKNQKLWSLSTDLCMWMRSWGQTETGHTLPTVSPTYVCSLGRS